MVTEKNEQQAILLIEDDAAVARVLTEVLEEEGYSVLRAATAAAARPLLEPQSVALVMLDLVLPDADGLVLCADIKARFNVPVMVCSARTDKSNRLLAFRLGADDFVGKPFDVDELLARVGALLRRTANAPHAAARTAGAAPVGEELRVGEMTLDLSHRRAMLEGKELHLTRTELRLLTAMMRHPDEVLTRQQLIEAVWGDKGAGVGRTIEPHVHRLRAKLNAAASHPPALLSIRGRGYALTTTPERLLAA